MNRRITYTVQGRGTFPIDMLRYDGAHPVDQESVEAIENIHRGHGLRQVRLEADRCTVGRWNSFLWGITPETLP